MRIISGTARRREIRVPKDVARPSTDRLREALFSILNQRVEGARVLDLFAGSGALGLECLSRGASSCAFVDASRESARVIKQNLTNTKLAGGHVSHADVFKHLSSARGEYDLIFADPPYLKHEGGQDFIAELLACEPLAKLLAPDGILVLEDPPRNQRGDQEPWELIDQRKYGSCGILFYQTA